MGTGWLSHVGEWASAWPEGLWRASWQGALGVALVWALTRVWPRIPASLRAGLWWLVALKFVVSLGWPRPVSLPLLPASLAPKVEAVASASLAPGVPAASRASHGPETASPALTVVGAPSSAEVVTSQRTVPGGEAAPTPSASPASVSAPVPWGRVLMGVLLAAWAAGVLWQLRSHVKGWATMRRLRQGARPLAHPVLESEVRALSNAAGLRRVPGLLVSDSVASPLATGLLSPVVVLPAKAVRRLPVEALRMALAHELAHLRRGDLWLGWVPALAEALLFFHPLARRAAREYALAREEACDAEALRLTGAEPADYGELLLAFGVARGAGTAAAHGASAHIHALHRRLSMLEHVEAVPARPRRLLKVALSALGLAALVPFQVVAQESAPKAGTPAAAPAPAKPASPAGASQQAAPAKPAGGASSAPASPSTSASAPQQAAPAAPAKSAASPSSAAPRVATPPVPPVPPTPRVAGVPPVPPAPRVAGVPPVPPVPPAPRVGFDDDDSSYVLLADNMATMNGSSVDLNLAGMFKQPGKELLYVRRKGEAFIIRDPATLKTVRTALEPARELGKAQGELGGKQGELGGKQGELGRKQGELGRQQGALGLKQAELAHKRAGLHLEERRLDSLPEAERKRREAELEKQEQVLDKEMEALDKQMDALGEQMEVLGRAQEKLGEQQEVLGREQEKLGAQQEKLMKEAEKKVQSAIDEALRKGLGQPLPT